MQLRLQIDAVTTENQLVRIPLIQAGAPGCYDAGRHYPCVPGRRFARSDLLLLDAKRRSFAPIIGPDPAPRIVLAMQSNRFTSVNSGTGFAVRLVSR
jgi:hypothetical protein